jgi:type IV pilus assembly protein PilV
LTRPGLKDELIMKNSTLRKQRGFSLIEVLVTTVVFSIGVLGVSGLNAFSQRASFESVQRSTAAELGFSLMEEMRYNTAALNDYLAAGDLGGGSVGAEPAPGCDDPLVPCTATQLALHGLWAWEQQLDGGKEVLAGAGSGGLVSPTVCIAGPAGGLAGNYTVTLVWRGISELTDPAVNACGAGSGMYGATNGFRRMVVVQSFISPNI